MKGTNSHPLVFSTTLKRIWLFEMRAIRTDKFGSFPAVTNLKDSFSRQLTHLHVFLIFAR
jgi:hypothetical protein